MQHHDEADDELLEDEWPDEEWEDEDEGELEEDEPAPAELTRTLRFGLFAMAPLLVTYELALSLGDGAHRAVSESLLTLPFAAIAGGDAALARRVVVGLALVVALHDSLRHVEAAGRRAVRVAVEGALAALLLIPLLDLIARRVPVSAPHGAELGVADAAAAMGGAAYDELLFRILLLSAAFVGLRALLGVAGVRGRLASVLGAAGAALVASARKVARVLARVIS